MSQAMAYTGSTWIARVCHTCVAVHKSQATKNQCSFSLCGKCNLLATCKTRRHNRFQLDMIKQRVVSCGFLQMPVFCRPTTANLLGCNTS